MQYLEGLSLKYICLFRIFAENSQDINFKIMFIERIKQLREERQMPQRQLAAALEIDTATYCKIEKGERKVKREQVFIIAQILKTDAEELLSLWLADQVTVVVADEKRIANKVLDIVKENIKG
jgi:transcriptional regulator with XRE-family HTH domain